MKWNKIDNSKEEGEKHKTQSCFVEEHQYLYLQLVLQHTVAILLISLAQRVQDIPS